MTSMEALQNDNWSGNDQKSQNHKGQHGKVQKLLEK